MFLTNYFYELRRGYKKELFIILGSVLCVVMMLSLYSYNIHDPSWLHYSSESQRIHNLCGVFGAQCAALFVYLFGVAAYLFIPFLCVVLLWLLSTSTTKKEWERFLAVLGIVICGAALFSVHRLEVFPTAIPGGYVGYTAMSFLYRLFDRVGSLLVLYASFYGSLVLLIRFSFISLVHRFICAASHIYNVFIRNDVVQKVGKAFYRMIHGLIAYGCVFSMKFFEFFVRRSWGVYGMQNGKNTNKSGVLVQEDAAYNHEASPSTGVQVSDVSVEASVSSLADGTKTADNVRYNDDTVTPTYMVPDATIFSNIVNKSESTMSERESKECARILEEKLERFGVYGSVISIKSGPVVTLFEYQPKIDTKLSKILALEDDLALALQALSIRILAPIPGRSVVGFEVAHKNRKDVLFYSIMKSPEYGSFGGMLPLILGQDTVGDNVVVDLVKMPHLLVAGSTGSGKSVALHAMLASLLCKCTPEELRLILVDPKHLEFAPYSDIAHLLFPIITGAREAVSVFKWVLKEMRTRYEHMSQRGVRNIFEYNESRTLGEEKLPCIVIVIDELADLMMLAGRDIEGLIIRITQMARAAGIHMIVATQRPSVDVITGLIKVNFPSRISCRVASKIDSRTILDCGGADKLLGKGDMLFLDSTASLLRRVHGAYISNDEVGKITAHIKQQGFVQYLDIVQEGIDEGDEVPVEDEELYRHVVSYLGKVDDVSISSLQRQFRIGYNRSARIIAMLESRGLIMPSDGGKARRVIK